MVPHELSRTDLLRRQQQGECEPLWRVVLKTFLWVFAFWLGYNDLILVYVVRTGKILNLVDSSWLMLPARIICRWIGG